MSSVPADTWPVMTLADAGVTLIDCVHKTPPAQPVGLPYIAIPQMKEGRLDFADARKITSQDFADWTKKALPQVDDVVLSRRCNPGTTAAVKDGTQFALGQNLVLLRSNGSHVFPGFLQWLVRGKNWWDEIGRFINVGAVFDSLRCADVPKFELPIPPLEEQQAIASVLGSLDDKIELNRRMNRTMEQMAAAIFKAWFVDFEPVRAKASGAASFPGVPQPVFDALPATFADSELGPIPEGWEAQRLPDIIEVNPKRTLKKGEPAPHLDMKNMPTQGHAPEAWSERPFGSGMKFINGDTLVARITPCLENGKTAFVDFLEDGLVGWGSTEYIVLRPKPPFPEVYAYCLARTGDFRDFAIQNMTGTSGRQRVPATALDHYPLVRPDETTAKAFGEIVEPLFTLIRSNMDESRSLAEARDALLPKLLSGEVQVGKTAMAEISA